MITGSHTGKSPWRVFLLFAAGEDHFHRIHGTIPVFSLANHVNVSIAYSTTRWYALAEDVHTFPVIGTTRAVYRTTPKPRTSYFWKAVLTQAATKEVVERSYTPIRLYPGPKIDQ